MKLKRFPLFSSSTCGYCASSTSALICASLLGSASLSQGAVIVQDNFNYGDGGLSGQNGGIGWGSNVWFGANSSVVSNVAVGSQGAWDQAQKRNFASSLGDSAGATAILWLSFDWGHSAQVGAGSGYGGLTFYTGTSDGGSENFLFGNPWSGTAVDGEWNISGGTGDQTTGISSNGMKTGVAKFDLGAGTVSLWVGATGSPVDVSGTADASVSGVSLAGIKGIRILGYNGSASQSFDNLIIGTALLDADATRSTAIWTAGSSTWSTAGNWLDNVVGSSGKTASFSTLNITADTTVNLDSAVTIGNLVFGDTDTSSAAGWTLANNGNSDYILTLAGTTPTITVNALGDTKTATISAVVAGTEGLTKAGVGTLTLSAANTYTGATTISAGTLQLGDGGTTGSLSTNSDITNDGNLTINRSNAVTQGTDFSGSAITGSGSFTQAGTGTTTLNAANTYTGTTTVSAGTLLATKAAALPGYDTASRVSVANGATLAVRAGGAGEWTSGEIDSLLGATTDAFASGSNLGIDVTTGNTFSYANDIGATQAAKGLVKSGDGMLTLTGANTFTGNATVSAGTLKLQGTAFSTTARTYAIATGAVLNLDGNTGVASGTTTLSGTGTLRITGGTFSNEDPNSPKGDDRDITMAMGSGAVIDVQSGATMYNGGWQNVTWTSNKADLKADGTFNLADGKSVFVDALTGAGSVGGSGTVGGGGGTQLLTVGVDDGSGTFSGTLTGGIGLTKDGTGTQTLSGTISYTGTTTVSNGTLVISGQPYFNTGRTTTVASGAVLELNNSNNTFTSLMSTSTVTGAGTFRLSGNSTINQELDGTVSTRLTFAMDSGGLIDLQGTSRLTNGGWQEMNWTNNKADMNIASGATLDVWDGQDVIIDALNGSGTVDKVHGGNSPRLLKIGIDNGSGTFSGTIQNTGGQLAITKTGTGTQTFSGTNTYDGATTVSEGTLLINGNQSGASGAVSVASGATLGGTGTVGGATTISGTHTPGTSPGVQSFSSDLSYASTSIFEWDLANSAAGTRGTDYDGVNVGGELSGASGATFKVVLGAGAFTDAFWDTTQTWTGIFKAAVDGSGSALNIASVFSNIAWYQGATDMTGRTGTEGSFTISGSSLTWTAVPEPTSALAGLLITAGLLRRRRAVRGGCFE